MLRYIGIVLLLLCFNVVAETKIETSTSELETKVALVQNRVNLLEQKVYDNSYQIESLSDAAKDNALTLLLFAFFCAWWAKTTGRSAVVWFLLGLFFHVITAIVLISKTVEKPNHLSN